MSAASSPLPLTAAAVEPTGLLTALILDENVLTRIGVRALLATQEDFRRCVGAESLEDALVLADRYCPHIAIVGEGSGGYETEEIISALHARRPRLRVLFLGRRPVEVGGRLRREGANGLLVPDGDPASIVDVVRRVVRGEDLFPPRETGDSTDPPTCRQRIVLALMADGATIAEIGRRLHLSPETIKDEASVIYRKLHARNRAQAIIRADRRGWVGC